MARFANVSCSQCGEDFGPGDEGFSACTQHEARLEPHEALTLFLILMRESGSWDVHTLDRAIEAALNVCKHATRSTPAGREAIASVSEPSRSEASNP